MAKKCVVAYFYETNTQETRTMSCCSATCRSLSLVLYIYSSLSLSFACKLLSAPAGTFITGNCSSLFCFPNIPRAASLPPTKLLYVYIYRRRQRGGQQIGLLGTLAKVDWFLSLSLSISFALYLCVCVCLSVLYRFYWFGLYRDNNGVQPTSGPRDFFYYFSILLPHCEKTSWRVKVFIMVFQPIRVIQCASCVYCRCSLMRNEKKAVHATSVYAQMAEVAHYTSYNRPRRVFLPSTQKRMCLRFGENRTGIKKKCTRRLTCFSFFPVCLYFIYTA